MVVSTGKAGDQGRTGDGSAAIGRLNSNGGSQRGTVTGKRDDQGVRRLQNQATHQ